MQKKQPRCSEFHPIWPLTSFPFSDVCFKNGCWWWFRRGNGTDGPTADQTAWKSTWWAETLPRPRQSVNQYPFLICIIIIGFRSSSVPALYHSTQVQMGPTSWNAMGRLAPWHFKCIWLASLDCLIEWEKNLRGQRTNTAFQNRVLFIAEARRCAYHRTNCLRAQKEKACQRPVCQHIMVPPSETLTAPRVRFCAERGFVLLIL